jgi:hypothetical protein
MGKKILYFFGFLLGCTLALTVIYIEWQILSEMAYFEEPTYYLPSQDLTLKSSAAALIHISNFSLGLLAVITASYFYGKIRK